MASIVEVIGTNELFTFKFTVPADAAAGDTYTFTVVIDDTKVQFCTSDEDKVTVSAEPFVATVVSSEVHTHKWSHYNYSTYKTESGTIMCVTEGVCDCGHTETIADRAGVAVGRAPVFDSGLELNIKFRPADVKGFTNLYVVADKERIGTDTHTPETLEVTTVGSVLQANYKGIAANQLSNKLDIKLFGTDADGNVILLTRRYDFTFADDMMTQYNTAKYLNAKDGTVEAAYRTLLVDLLNYGAGAQTYTGYNTDNLANATVPQTYATPDITDYKDDYSKTGSLSVGRSAVFGSSLMVNIKAKYSEISGYGDNFYIRVDYYDAKGNLQTADYHTGDYTVSNGTLVLLFDKITPAAIAKPFTISFCDSASEDALMTMTYSIETYCKESIESAKTGETMKAMAKYTAKYGRSADAFFNFE